MTKKNNSTINSDGGPIFMGKVDNRKGKISGRSDINNIGANPEEVEKILNSVFMFIERNNKLSEQDKTDVKVEFKEIWSELEKKDQADEGFVMRRLRNIGRMAPDILDVILATIVHPAVGFGVVAKKIAEKANKK